ncbi:TRAP transporter large permease [bacterium LRH843]|nr:TRAP transporter large permease [bacterium LRH843]
MLLVLGLVILATLIMGVPVAFSLGIGGAAALLYGSDVSPLLVLGGKIFRGMESFPLMAIPFFILSGELMGISITTRIVNFASTLVGHIRGGLSQVTVVASFFFGGITGVGVAETAAIGSVMIPAMEKKGYKKSFAASLVAASSTLGPIVPPSVPMVIYALAVGGGVSIASLFLAGIIPAILITVSFMVLSYVIARIKNHPTEGEFSLKNVWIKLKKAAFALLMPFVILGGIVSGLVTATEAAVIAVVYALILGFFVHKDLEWRNIPRYMVNTSVITAVVMMLIGIARVVSWILTVEGFPQLLSESLQSITTSPLMFLFITAGILFLVGCFVEGSAAIIMLAPVLAPIALSYNIDPTHFGFAMVMNLMLGMITPPVGVILFVASGIANIKLEDLLKEIWPYIVVAYTVLILVIVFPETTLFIPRLFGF